MHNSSIQDKIAAHFADAPIKTYPKDSIIITAGDEPTGVMLLINGRVEQYDITPEGDKISVNVFRPSSFFPMSWAINKSPNEFYYGALTDVTLCVAPAEKTVLFLQKNPDVLFDLISRVYKGTDALLRRLVLASSSTASNRLMFELLIESYRFGTTQPSTETTISIKQAELAARSGLARETVSRELQKLEQSGLISRSSQSIVLNPNLIKEQLDIEM